MYNILLQNVTSLVNVIGTIYAVLSILKLSPDDINKKITVGGMDEVDKDALLQREQARTGIGLIIIGWLLQFVFGLLTIKNLCGFICCISVTIGLVLLWFIFMKFANRKFKENYEKSYQSKN